MNYADHLLETIGELYESIVDEAAWPRALEALSDFAGGRGTFYVRADPRSGLIVHSESVGVDPLVNERYLKYYAGKEVRLRPALALPAGLVTTEAMLIERRALEHSEIYADRCDLSTFRTSMLLGRRRPSEYPQSSSSARTPKAPSAPRSVGVSLASYRTCSARCAFAKNYNICANSSACNWK